MHWKFVDFIKTFFFLIKLRDISRCNVKVKQINCHTLKGPLSLTQHRGETTKMLYTTANGNYSPFWALFHLTVINKATVVAETEMEKEYKSPGKETGSVSLNKILFSTKLTLQSHQSTRKCSF